MKWDSRAEKPADISAIREINRAAFPTLEEADLVDALRQDPAWVRELSVVTLDANGTPIGFTLLTRCYIDQSPALCLGPCAVLPEYQNSGVGTAGIRFALQSATELGEDYVVVLGHANYYPRFGFNRASLSGIRLSIEVPDEALMAMSLNDSRKLPAGLVRYPAPFGI